MLTETGERFLERFVNDTALFARTTCFRSPDDIDEDVLNKDDDIVRIHENRGYGSEHYWTSLHRCVVREDYLVQYLWPNPAGARGTIQLIGEEMKRDLGPEIFGVSRSTRTEIEFENGSRIVCRQVTDSGDSVRGYGPDLLVVNAIEQEGRRISDDVFEQVLYPMTATGTQMWIDATSLAEVPHVDLLLEQGVYIQRSD